MKKLLLSLLYASAILFCFPAHAQTRTEKVNETQNNNNASANKLNGTWQTADGRFFMMLYDGFYSQIGQDSTGKLPYVETGTYTIDDNTNFTFNVRYASKPSHIGALHTFEYEIDGETLMVKTFKRLVDPKEGDITARMKSWQARMIRATK